MKHPILNVVVRSPSIAQMKHTFKHYKYNHQATSKSRTMVLHGPPPPLPRAFPRVNSKAPPPLDKSRGGLGPPYKNSGGGGGPIF